MRGFFRSNAFKLMLIMVLVLSAVTILSITVGDRTITSFFEGIISPMQKTATALLGDEVDNLGLKSMTRADLEAYASGLAEENAELRQNLADYYDVKQKNEQYSQVIGVLNDNPDFRMTAASVISRDPTDIFYSFSLDVGSLDGISVNDPVITAQGLVGLVTEVYASSCRVTTIYSEDVMLGAVSERTSENGIIESDATGANSGILTLKYLDKSTKIEKGDVITTSNYGGVFPKGLVIGTVSILSPSDRDISVDATVLPAADIKNVGDCFVITYFSGKGQTIPYSITESRKSDDGGKR